MAPFFKGETVARRTAHGGLCMGNVVGYYYPSDGKTWVVIENRGVIAMGVSDDFIRFTGASDFDKLPFPGTTLAPTLE